MRPFSDWDAELPKVLGYDPYADMEEDDAEEGEGQSPLLPPASPLFDPDRTVDLATKAVMPPTDIRETLPAPKQATKTVILTMPGAIPPEPPDPTEVHLWTGTGERLDMSEIEARHVVSAIRGSEMRLQSLLMDLHDRKGWKALRYHSWEDCLASEFDISSKTHYYYLQKIGAVYQTLLGSGMFEQDDLRKVKNSHLATLATLPPERQAEGLVLSLARAESKEYGGMAALTLTGKLTDKIVREIVEEMKRPTNTQIAEKRATTKPVEASNTLRDAQSSAATPVAPAQPVQAAAAPKPAATVPIPETPKEKAPEPTPDSYELAIAQITFDHTRQEFLLRCHSRHNNEWKARLTISRLRAVLIDAGVELGPWVPSTPEEGEA